MKTTVHLGGKRLCTFDDFAHKPAEPAIWSTGARPLRHGDKQVGADGLLWFADRDGEIEDLDVVLADIQALRLAADENRQRRQPPVPGRNGAGGGPPVGIRLFYRASSGFGLLVLLRLPLQRRFQRCFGLVQFDLGSISRGGRGFYRPVASVP